MKRILKSNKKQACILATLIRSFSATELREPCSRKQFSGSCHQNVLLLVISDLQFIKQTVLNTLYHLLSPHTHSVLVEEQRVGQRSDLPKWHSVGLLSCLPVPKLYLRQLWFSNIGQGFESPPLFPPEELCFLACGCPPPVSLSNSLFFFVHLGRCSLEPNFLSCGHRLVALHPCLP